MRSLLGRLPVTLLTRSIKGISYNAQPPNKGAYVGVYNFRQGRGRRDQPLRTAYSVYAPRRWQSFRHGDRSIASLVCGQPAPSSTLRYRSIDSLVSLA